MKKKIMTCLLPVFLTITFKAYSQVQWGIRAGGNMSAVLSKDETGYEKVKLHPGFHVGGTADIALARQFLLQPGLIFTTKGFKADNESVSFGLAQDENIKFTPYYIELPVNFIFKPQMGSGNFLVGVGPYVAYGLGGRWKATSNNISVKGKMKFVNDIADVDSSFGGSSRTIPYVVKPFDFGGNILIGYEFQHHFYFQANGQLGLINGDPSYNGVHDERSSTRTVQFGLSIGYKF